VKKANTLASLHDCLLEIDLADPDEVLDAKWGLFQLEKCWLLPPTLLFLEAN
jgi:hypothetical protein